MREFLERQQKLFNTNINAYNWQGEIIGKTYVSRTKRIDFIEEHQTANENQKHVIIMDCVF